MTATFCKLEKIALRCRIQQFRLEHSSKAKFDWDCLGTPGAVAMDSVIEASGHYQIWAPHTGDCKSGDFCLISEV